MKILILLLLFITNVFAIPNPPAPAAPGPPGPPIVPIDANIDFLLLVAAIFGLYMIYCRTRQSPV